MMDINVDLLRWFTNDKKSSDSGIKYISDDELAKESHKPIIRNFNKRKVHSPFIDNIWGADLADMQLINKFKGFRLKDLKDLGFNYVIDIYNKYD